MCHDYSTTGLNALNGGRKKVSKLPKLGMRWDCLWSAHSTPLLEALNLTYRLAMIQSSNEYKLHFRVTLPSNFLTILHVLLLFLKFESQEICIMAYARNLMKKESLSKAQIQNLLNHLRSNDGN